MYGHHVGAHTSRTANSPVMTNEVDTGLSTLHDLRPELFVGLDVSRQTVFPAIKPRRKRKKRKKKAVPLCGNLLTRRAFDFRNTVSVSYISPSQFTATPWGGHCMQLWACERERWRDRGEDREEAKPKLITPLAYRHCVDILLAISKV